MNIELKLNKDFENKLDELSKKYGEDFLYINGIHPSQLDFSEFLGKFIDNKTMADATIDPNANANHKDIRSFMTEKAKSEDKLFGLAKIYLEIKKKYGKRTADEWLEQEFTRGFYLNDSSSASYFPYCYKYSELIIIKYRGKKLLTSFEQLYNIIEEPEVVFDIDKQIIGKYPKDLFVQDYVDNKFTFTPIYRIVKKKKDTNFRFIKTANGFSQIVTDDHPMITQNGEVKAKELIKTDKLTTFSSPVWTGDVETIYLTDYLNNTDDYKVYYNGNIVENDKFYKEGQVYIKRLKNKKLANRFLYPTENKLTLTKELGYIIGLTITDGSYNSYKIKIKQKASYVSDKLEECFKKCNILFYKSIEPNINVYTICSETLCEGLFAAVIPREISFNKKFSPEIINYNKDFISGILGGFIDGDGTTGYINNTERHIDGFSGFSNSRTLYNQIVYMLRCFGYLPKAFVQKNKDNWFRFSAKIYKDKKYQKIFSTKIENNCVPWITEAESLARVRNGYNNSDDSAYVFYNDVLSSNDEFVYDITTETHHFLCNQILSHNCWANSLEKLAKEGLFFLNNYNNQPPKHLTTYFDDVIEFVSFLSNRQSGRNCCAHWCLFC